MTVWWTGPGPIVPGDKALPYPLLPTAPWTTLRVAHMPTPSTTLSPTGRGPPPGYARQEKSPHSGNQIDHHLDWLIPAPLRSREWSV